ITWDNLGVDLLVVDEAADYKNLYLPEPREGGVPKYMGGEGEGSDRAWQLDFRAHTIRERTGGAGVVLLTATPAKNSPLEFYNLIQYIDPRAWKRVGIHDPEEFIDRYIRIESRDVPNAALDIVRRSAVVGFKNLDELRSVIFRYSEFRTAKEVGIELPQPRKHTVEVAMDEAQEEKYRDAISVIEQALEEPGPSPEILGLQQRLAMVALHADGDEGYDWNNAEGGIARRKVTVQALGGWLERGWTRSGEIKGGLVPILRDLPRPDPHSAKFEAIAQRVVASHDCGHIVFCEPKAAHRWLRTVLIEAGIPADRIAVMNGSVTTAADRQRIAKQFNGDAEAGIEPDFDVVIANRVAYEGVDLQVRTCAIHHADLPWTPSDLEQRNGRAWRQGNTLGTIEIYYYMSKRSMDGYRFGILHGKATWLEDLLKSDKSAVNNPATEDIDLEELLIHISRDPEKTKRLIEHRKQREEEERRRKEAARAGNSLRRASARFRDARTTENPERAAELRVQGEKLLKDLRKIPTNVWPWARWIDHARETEFMVPDGGASPVFEGLRVPREAASAAYEFGRVRLADGKVTIGRRMSGGAQWEELGESQVATLGLVPDDLEPLSTIRWPADDDERTERAIAEFLRWFFRSGRPWAWSSWLAASDAFLERWWPRFEKTIHEGLAASYAEQQVPIVVDGALRLAKGRAILDGVVIPMTLAGWREYLRLAPSSGHKLGELRQVGQAWWARRVPRGLLLEEREDGEVAAAMPSAPFPPGMVKALERAQARKAGENAERIASQGTSTARDVWLTAALVRMAPAAEIEVLTRSATQARIRLSTKADGVTKDPVTIGMFDLYPSKIAFLIEPETDKSALLRWARELIDAALHDDDDRIRQLGQSGAHLRLPRDRFVPQTYRDLAGAPDRTLGELAALLKDLASRSDFAPSELQQWFSEFDFTETARLLEEYLESDGHKDVDDTVRALEAALTREMPSVVVEAAREPGRITVPAAAIWEMGGKRYVLLADGRRPLRGRVRRVVAEQEIEGEPHATVDLDRPTPEGAPPRVYVGDDEARFRVEEGYRRFQELVTILEETPVFVESARTMIARASALAAGPVCTGEERKRVALALWRAYSLYNQAATAVRNGNPIVAAEHVAQISEAVASVAEALAESCAEGQLTIAAPVLPSTLEDAAALARRRRIEAAERTEAEA
ncbi:MAG: helicase-related protein, partial [Nannocystaceae bacterium]